MRLKVNSGFRICMGSAFTKKMRSDKIIWEPISYLYVPKPYPVSLQHKHFPIHILMPLMPLMPLNSSIQPKEQPGLVMAQGLKAMFSTVAQNFSPHSLHCYFINDHCHHLNWSVDEISQGNNFVNRSTLGKDADHQTIGCYMMASFTTRNSYESALEKYLKYQQLIAERRAQGKTEDDDDEEDIRPVDVPFKFQVPFPSQLKDLQLKQLHLISSASGNIELKLPPDGTVEVGGDPIGFFAKLQTLDTNKFTSLCRLADVFDMLTYRNNKWVVQERVIYFHDVDYDIDNYLAFQGRVLSKLGKLLLVELEVFNLNGVQVGTMVEACSIERNKL